MNDLSTWLALPQLDIGLEEFFPKIDRTIVSPGANSRSTPFVPFLRPFKVHFLSLERSLFIFLLQKGLSSDKGLQRPLSIAGIAAVSQ